MNHLVKLLDDSDIERFWSLVVMAGLDECWPWKQHCTTLGYGVFGMHQGRNKQLYAHQIAAFVVYGWPPDDKPQTCHTCDNPPCCNPNHLFYGSQKDNNADCGSKSRNGIHRNPQVVRGSNNGNSKLTEEQVRHIRRSKMSRIEIMCSYRVSRTLASLIRRGKVWPHV